MSNAPEKCGSLLRILGIVFGVAAVVGGMVGQGILRTPGIVAGAVHSPGLIMLMWFCGALLVAVSSFAYVELGTAIPCAGGPYDFVRRAFGEVPGVIAGWGGWLICISTLAFMATVVAEFSHRLGVWPGVPTPLFAVSVLAVFWAVNWTGTRVSGDSQVIFSAAKGIGLIALVILLFAHPLARATTTAEPLSGSIGIAGLAIAMRVVINTYAGWEDTVYHCEELKNPERTLPRAMATGIISVAILYLVVNLALLHVLSPAEMASSKLPAADAARHALGPWGDVAITAFGILSVAAITNLYVMRAARVSFAMARQGELPEKLSCVAPSGTPRWALTASVIMAAGFAATGTYETLIAIQVGLSVTLLAAVNNAVIRLRQKEPTLPRPFRMPLYPAPAILAIAINLTMLAALVFEDPVHSLTGLAILALVGGVYWTMGLGRKRRLSEA